MDKKSKILQTDSKGQIVIPKEIRDKLNIGQGTGFFIYEISNSELLLKKIDEPKMDSTKVKNLIRRKV